MVVKSATWPPVVSRSARRTDKYSVDWQSAEVRSLGAGPTATVTHPFPSLSFAGGEHKQPYPYPNPIAA
jgi:hypothetical protein